MGCRRRHWRVAVRAGCAMAAVAVPLAWGPTHAQAIGAGAGECIGTVSFSYSAVLGTAPTGGTIGTSYDRECEGAFFEGLFAAEYGGGNTMSPSYSFSGSCTLASFSGSGAAGLLVGGAVAVVDNTVPAYTEVDVMAPLLAPCLETSSLGTTHGVSTETLP